MKLPKELWLMVLKEKSRLERRENMERAKKVLEKHLYSVDIGTVRYRTFGHAFPDIKVYTYFYTTPYWFIEVLPNFHPPSDFRIQRTYRVDSRPVKINTEMFLYYGTDLVHITGFDVADDDEDEEG